MTNPLSEFYDADPNVEDVYPLDALNDGFVPSGDAGELIRQTINQAQCEKMRVVKLTTGEFFLRWDERHPEMVSLNEYTGAAEGDRTGDYSGGDFSKAKRDEHRKLYDVLPSKSREKPLTREQVLALVVAVTAPDGFADEFEPEIDALWPSA
jgi:hypothetical protein